jgi:thiol-disulfide isomerase/thioredoxin
VLYEAYKLKKKDFPQIRIFNSADKGKTMYDIPFSATEITFEKLDKVLKAYIARELFPYYESDPIPEVNDKASKVIVGKTFGNIVFDPTKDLFIKFYAPWCNLSKKVAPIWEELAEELKDVPNLIIAEMDATTNLVP